MNSPTELGASVIEAAVDDILSQDWYWFPVRHHSPAVARQVQAAILQRRPKLLLIEGPADANALIPFLADRKTRPPVAIYSCFQDTTNHLQLAGIASATPDIAPRWAAWYPFVDYSPELVALRTAMKLGADVCFMDLPHYGRLAVEANQLIDQPTATSDSERWIAESSFYRALATAGGYKSWDEGWDALFECRTFENNDLFRKELLSFCAAARATSSLAHANEGETIDRERFMLKTIRESIARSGVRNDQVMILCGGLHVFMNQEDPTPPPDFPPGDVYTTLVPYSNFRISNLSGYGAGNRAPQYYAMQWDAANGRLDNPTAHYIVSVLQAARKLGDSLSAADAISVAQHARLLAGLRGRAEPVLDDLHDALYTCCCKGNPTEQGIKLSRAIDRVDSGTRVGSVTVGVPKLPLVADFYDELERLELKELAENELVQRHTLDKRESVAQERSAFFHRLQFIDVPFCQLEGSPETDFTFGLIFRERWQSKWSPNVEAKLIERNLLGDTLESAAINRLKQRLVDHQGQAGQTCQLLVRGLQMHLPGMIDRVFEQAVQAVEDDHRFASLCEAVTHLSVLDRHALHAEMKREQIAAMLARTFERACFAMPDIATAPDDQHLEIISGLTTLADRVLKGQDAAQSQLFAHYLAATCSATQVPMLKGALLGLSVEIRLIPTGKLMEEIHSFAISPAEQMVGAGDFIHGVIAVSRASIMAGASELVDALDELLKAADWDVFITMLPRLRAGMEMLHARHRDSLAERVAEKYGLKDDKPLQKLQLSVTAAARIAALDQKVARIMAEWNFES